MLLASGLCAIALARRARAAGGSTQLAFAALRNGHKIGEQRMSFERDDGLTVRTQADMAVRLGPVALFHYRHEAVERWRDDRFVSLETETNDNGKMVRVSARRSASGVAITPAVGAAVQAPQDALPFSHWNRAIARAPLFNPQDGKLLRETVSAPASGAVQLADGSSRRAEKVVFQGDAYIEDWYGEDDAWLGLAGRLKDGSMLEYRRL